LSNWPAAAEAADGAWYAGLPDWTRLVKRARELIGLTAHQGDQALLIIAWRLDRGSAPTNVRIDLDLVAITRSGTSTPFQSERAKVGCDCERPLLDCPVAVQTWE
jgi:hypothetical protein